MSDEAAHEHFLGLAIDAATRGASEGRGGPFGAVVVKDGTVLATGCNAVPTLNDPTAHAEIQAIRAACLGLKTFVLQGCTVYASAEPCPMCLGALYWARVDRVFFAATRSDAAAAGFDDALIYDELARPLQTRNLPMQCLPLPRAAEPFDAWLALPGNIRVPY